MRNEIIIALLSFTVVSAQEKAVPVDQEPLHKVVLKNDNLEVMHVTIAPGQSTLLHTHSRDRLAVVLSEAIVKEDVPGKESAKAVAMHIGDISAPAHSNQRFTHRISNAGTTAFEAIDIELLKRPAGASTKAMAVPAAENAGFRAYRWSLAPRTSTPVHTHSRPYLILAATPMQLEMKVPDGASMAHPVKTGDSHWIDGKVTHVLANNGNEAGVIVEVELR